MNGLGRRGIHHVDFSFSGGVFDPEGSFFVAIREAKRVVRPLDRIVRSIAPAADHRPAAPGTLCARSGQPDCIACGRPDIRVYLAPLIPTGERKGTT